MRIFELRTNGTDTRLFERDGDYSQSYTHKPFEFPRVLQTIEAIDWKAARNQVM